MAQDTMPAGFVDAMSRYALSIGVDEQALFDGTKLSLDELSHPEKRVALTEASILWGNATRLSGDPAFSLHLGEASACSSMSILGMLGESCSSLGDALEQVSRFSRLAGNSGPTLTIGEEHASVAINSGTSELGKSLAENNFARMVTGIRRGIAGELELERVCFQHSKPDYLKEYSRIFAAPVLFDQATSSIRFPVAFLASPLGDSNAYLNKILSERASQLFEDAEFESTLSGQVATHVAQHAHKGTVSANECAEALNMSRQTLHRKLKREGTTFRQTVDLTRKQLAMDYLANQKHSVTEIASLLGFSETSSFNRAFKRWTGLPPSKARG